MPSYQDFSALRGAWGLQTVRGVIFASGLQREVFTAGNDIKELYVPQTSIARQVLSSATACACMEHAAEFAL